MDEASERAFGCVRNTIRLRSGRYFDLADPRPDQFEFDDIAGGLAHICRFGGQLPGFYSVAQHLVNCFAVARRRGCTPAELRAVLMHDAAEAFVGDVVKPLKVMLPDYARVERAVEACVGRRFGIDFDGLAAVWKPIDRAVLIAERRALIPDGVKWAGEDEVERVDIDAGPWGPPEARRRFLAAAAAVGLGDDRRPDSGS